MKGKPPNLEWHVITIPIELPKIKTQKYFKLVKLDDPRNDEGPSPQGNFNTSTAPQNKTSTEQPTAPKLQHLFDGAGHYPLDSEKLQ